MTFFREVSKEQVVAMKIGRQRWREIGDAQLKLYLLL